MNFRLSALSDFYSIRRNRSTLLHYLVKHIQRSTPDSSRFYEDLPTVTPASRLDSLAGPHGANDRNISCCVCNNARIAAIH
jgi:hypothetical protein